MIKKDDNKIDTKGLLISLFGVILMALLFLNMYLYVFANVNDKDFTPISFTYLMQSIESMPSFNVMFTNYNPIPDITADWSMFNFLRDFINMFTNLINLVIYLAQLLIGSIGWLMTLIGKFFFGVFSGGV